MNNEGLDLEGAEDRSDGSGESADEEVARTGDKIAISSVASSVAV